MAMDGMAKEGIDKWVRFNRSTANLERVARSIGFGCGTVGCLLGKTDEEGGVATGLKRVGDSIGLARYVLRLAGSLEAWQAVRDDTWCQERDGERVRQVVKMQAYAMLAYYPLEHASYVGFVAPKLLKIDGRWCMVQSCRAWLVYLLLDVYANQLRIQAIDTSLKQVQMDFSIPKEEQENTIRDLQKRRRELHYQQVLNACSIPPCLHWSLKRSPLPQSLMQVLCFTEAVLGLWRAWIKFN